MTKAAYKEIESRAWVALAVARIASAEADAAVTQADAACTVAAQRIREATVLCDEWATARIENNNINQE